MQVQDVRGRGKYCEFWDTTGLMTARVESMAATVISQLLTAPTSRVATLLPYGIKAPGKIFPSS